MSVCAPNWEPYSRVSRGWPVCLRRISVPPSRELEIWSQLSIENDHDGAIMCTSARCFCIELLCACNLGLPDMQLFLYAFDPIELNGDDLRRDPLEVRKGNSREPCSGARRRGCGSTSTSTKRTARSCSRTLARWAWRASCRRKRSPAIARGLVMIEAMACGTPVLAFRQGSVAEIIDQGVTGAIIEMDEAMMILLRVIALDRRAVRRRFEQRFSSARIATDYVAVYRSLLKRPSISERETTVPMPRPVLEKRLNGQGLSGDRAHRAAETDALI